MSFVRWMKQHLSRSGRRLAARKRSRRVLLAESLETRSLLAGIQGTVFNDLDASGVINHGEARLSGWEVYLDRNGNGVLDTDAQTIQRNSSNVPRNIPDAGAGSATSTLGIGGISGVVTDLDVKLTINHTWDEDLDVFLRGPSGQRVELFSDVGGSGQNFTDTVLDDEAAAAVTDGLAPFTGSFRPENPLTVFDGLSPNGVWTLEIFDDTADDVGRLVSWSLVVGIESVTEPVAVTNNLGAYSFASLPAGTENVRVAPRDGWSTVFPSGEVHVVTLGANETAGPINFGVRQAPSTLRGSMWNDFDGDGRRDDGEPALASKRVFLDANQNGTWDSTTLNQSFANNNAAAIPDGGAVRSPLNIPTDDGRLTDVNVTLNINHPSAGDLQAFLISPSGTRVRLFANVGGSGANFTGTTFDDSAATLIADGTPPFTGSFKPAQPLSALNNESAMGVWQLEIVDSVAGNTGTLNSWSLALRRVNAERSVLTNASGAYAFANVGPGTYHVAQAAIPRFTATAPRSAVLQPDQTVDFSRASNQREHQPSVAVDPSNPNRVFTVSMIGGFGNGFFAAVSPDAGATWTPRLLTGSDGLPLGASDPSVAFDSFGNLFLAYVEDTTDQIVLARSIDGGQTFNQFTRFSVGEKPAVIAGNGAVYLSFTGQNSFFVQDEIKVTGASVSGLGVVGVFSNVVGVPGSLNSSYSDLAIGPTGQLMVSYQADNNNGTPSVISVNIDPDGLGPSGFGPAVVAANTNVGTSNPIPAQTAYNVHAGAGIEWDRTGGVNNGRAYLVYTDEAPSGSSNLDVMLKFSDDQGATWSAPQRVNDDTGLFATKSQFLPELALDPVTGDLAITWYDARNDTGSPFSGGGTDGFSNNEVQLFGTVSVDGGQTFVTNLQIASGFTDAFGSGSPRGFGDHSGLALHGGVMYPVWVDNSNSTGNNPNGASNDFDLYTRVVRITQGGKAPYRVVVQPNTLRTDLHFANHQNPTLSVIPPTRTYRENTAPLLAPGATVSNVTAPNFEGGVLTVANAQNAESTDQISIRHQGAGAGQVSVAGSEVRVSNIAVGTVVGGDGANPLIIQFNANAQAADVQAILRNIRFRSLTDNPSTLQRRITFDLTDGHNGTSLTREQLITIEAVNDAPRLTNVGTSVTFEEDLPPVLVAPTMVVSDPDSANFALGQFTVSLTRNGDAADLLSIRSVGTGSGQISVSGSQVRFEGITIGTFVGGDGTNPLVVSLNSAATVRATQALARSIEFSTAGNDPSPLTREVSFVLTDGDGGTSLVASKDVLIRTIND